MSTPSRQSLDTGLELLVAHAPSVPLVELRLWIPFPWVPTPAAVLLAETLLAGTGRRDEQGVAAAAGDTGGGLVASVDADRLLITGSAHTEELDALLSLVAEVVTSATYPDDAVARRRTRTAHNAAAVRNVPAMRAFEALNHRLYGDHPYGLPGPGPAEITAVTPDDLRALHAERIRPRGAALVLAGDVGPPADLAGRVERAFAAWTGDGGPLDLHPVPALKPGPVERIPDPLVAQSMLRLVLPSVPRGHPDHAALVLANLVFGGYFSSRLVANLREAKGLCYSPRSEQVLVRAANLLLVSVDTDRGEEVLAEVTAELTRLPFLTPDELERARRFALGSLRLRTSTQAGLAAVLVDLVTQRLSPGWLDEHARRLAEVTPDEVAAAVTSHLTPENSLGVLLTPAR